MGEVDRSCRKLSFGVGQGAIAIEVWYLEILRSGRLGRETLIRAVALAKKRGGLGVNQVFDPNPWCVDNSSPHGPSRRQLEPCMQPYVHDSSEHLHAVTDPRPEHTTAVVFSYLPDPICQTPSTKLPTWSASRMGSRRVSVAPSLRV